MESKRIKIAKVCRRAWFLKRNIVVAFTFCPHKISLNERMEFYTLNSVQSKRWKVWERMRTVKYTKPYRDSRPMYFGIVKSLATSLWHASKLSTSSSVVWICIVKTTGIIKDCLQLLISYVGEEEVSLKSAVILN